VKIDFIARLSGKISIGGYFMLRIYSLTNKTLIHNSLYVFDNLGGGEM
jgi:hypothetical protein